MSAEPIVQGTEARVCADIAGRQRRGIQKYGQTVAENPARLRDWMQHAYEECLDFAVYLRRAMDEMDVAPAQIPPPPAGTQGRQEMPPVEKANTPTAFGYTKRETAALLKLSMRSMDGLLRTVDAPPHIRFGKKLFFPAEALADWIKRRTNGGRT